MDTERISGCTYPVREKDLDYTFDLFRRAGFTKLDLWGGLPNFSTDLAECDPVALRDKATAHGLRIANLGTYPGRRFTAEDPAEVEAELAEMERTIDIAVLLGSRSIRVSPGHGEDPSIVDRLVPLFQQSAAYAAQKGVYLGMENHRGSIAGIPDVCADLARRVGSPYFGVLYEPANLMAAGVDYRQAYEEFRGLVTHVHVKDSHWRGGKYARTMLGEGDVDMPWLVEELTKDGYEGDFALEFEIEKIVPIEKGLPKWFEYFTSL